MENSSLPQKTKDSIIDPFVKILKEINRRNSLYAKTILYHLTPQTTKIIADYHRKFYTTFNEIIKSQPPVKIPSDISLVSGHISRLINHFDCNYHYLQHNEIPMVAAMINENPLISFFIPSI
ncbi:MAG: hypothetical protein ABH887_00215 [bacterium]